MDQLSPLGQTYGTDKLFHGFTAFYDQHLAAGRLEVRKVLEIGILRGASLRMWRDYFPNATVHGFDTQMPRMGMGDRIVLHQGDQADRSSLRKLIEETGSDFDVIIDDGGHTMAQQQVSLGFLLPHLRAGGVYIVEDLHTSFYESIPLFIQGKQVGSYPTGVSPDAPTTCAVVESLVKNNPFSSVFMSADENAYVRNHIASGVLFDRDGDHAHMTSILWKK